MNDLYNPAEETVALLRELRDGQARALAMQEESLQILRNEAELNRTRIEESLGLQRQAIGRVRIITRVALPLVLLCVALLVYLFVKYRI